MPATKEQHTHLIALGCRIRELRQAKGITQKQLADLMGKDRQSLHRVEKAQVNPGYLFLVQLCEALDIDLCQLFQERLVDFMENRRM